MKNILDCYPEYEANIGIEVHVQLNTESKIFCSCPNEFGEQANKNICPVCSGYPGVLPVLNRKVVDSAIMLGVALNSTIAKRSDFARKHYMYPDLPKNFQITQDERPICNGGYLMIDLPDGSEKKIHLTRIHMEEDAGKNSHQSDGISFVDLNRTGTPLLETVSEPDMASVFEAKAYLNRLRTIVQYLGISDANMEEGSFRADVNISVRRKTEKELGRRVEVKNINSFKFIGQAIDFEIERQIKLIEEGGTISQDTRLWNEKKHETVFMRSKEGAQDYRYFHEPDLPLIVVDDQWIDRIKKMIPELPHKKLKRFEKDYGLTSEEAGILIEQLNLSLFFEKTAAICKKPKQVSNWILRDFIGYLNEHKIPLEKCKITPETLAELVVEIDKDIINSKTAQVVFEEMAASGKYPSIIIQEKGLKQLSSVDDLEPLILDIIKNNIDQVAKYKNGNERLFTFFVGQAMKATKGKGNPVIIKQLLDKHLK